MAIKGATISSNLRNDTPLLVLMALTWVAFFQITECSHTVAMSSLVLFAFWASLFALLLLKLLGYFDTLRLLPRKSDLLFVLIAIPFGGALEHILLESFFYTELCSLGEVLIWSPLVALVVFGIHNALELFKLRGRRRRKIVLDLLPEEAANVRADFAALGMSQYIAFINRSALRRHLTVGRAREISLVMISRNAASAFDTDALLIRAHLAGVPIVDCRRAAEDLMGKIRLSQADLWSYLLEATPQTALRRAYATAKRIVEPIVAMCLIVILSPLLLIAAVAIKLNSPGPVLYKQMRSGYLGTPFKLIKFRSMHQDAEKSGIAWCSANDARVTTVGKVLRKTRIDELPQLWNVVRGEMGFFGPRPERPEIYAKLAPAIPLFAMRNIVRPGISGWAQVCAGYANSVEDSLEKLEFDLYYIQHLSPRLDLIITLKTCAVILRGLFASELPEERKTEEEIMNFGVLKRWSSLALRRLGML